VKTIAGTSGVIVVLLLTGACTYHQSLRHPKLPQLAPIETSMDCPEIDLAIDRADTVRWVIRDDGGNLETTGQKAARYAGNVVVVPLSLLSYFPTYIDDGGHAVLHAADARIQELLLLKRERGCPPRTTAMPGVDDATVLTQLEVVQAALESGGGNQAHLFDEQTRLLDGLRIVPPAVSQSP
jgi:hypothetical protein